MVVPEDVISFTGMPLEKTTVKSSGVSGALVGEVVSFHMSSGGVVSVSSRIPASYEQWARFSSMLQGLDFVLVTGIFIWAA